MKGLGIIEAYHARRVAPLMMRVLPLYTMAPKASFDGTTLTEGVLLNSEIAQHIKEAMELLWDDADAPSILSTRCWDILRCDQNQAMSSS